MSRRLQVIVDEEECEAIQNAARARGMTISEWVRQTLRTARRQESTGDVERKLAALRRASRFAFPTADIGQMLAEIESGYRPADQ
jgi:hypothetical protein